MKPFEKPAKKRTGKKAQSFLEFAIFLPIFLMLFSGLIEFGFLLNDYLNVLDGPREAARWAVDASPFKNNADDPQFYTNVANVAYTSITPVVLNNKRNPSYNNDDIVISAFSVKYDSGLGKYTVVARYPGSAGLKSPLAAENQYSRNLKHTSRFSTADIEAKLNAAGSALAPNTGLILVEIFYGYEQKLSLPWITWAVPDPIQVSSFTIMPLPAAELK